MAKLQTGDRVLYAVNDKRFNALVCSAVDGFNRGTGVVGLHLTLAFVTPELKIPTVVSGVKELVEGKKVGFVLESRIEDLKDEVDRMTEAHLETLNAYGRLAGETMNFSKVNEGNPSAADLDAVAEEQKANDLPGGFYTDKSGVTRSCPIDGELTHCRECGAEMVMRGFGVPTCDNCTKEMVADGRLFIGTGPAYASEQQKAAVETDPTVGASISGDGAPQALGHPLRLLSDRAVELERVICDYCGTLGYKPPKFSGEGIFWPRFDERGNRTGEWDFMIEFPSGNIAAFPLGKEESFPVMDSAGIESVKKSIDAAAALPFQPLPKG
jgi:hypothetical protein